MTEHRSSEPPHRDEAPRLIAKVTEQRTAVGVLEEEPRATEDSPDDPWEEQRPETD